MDGAAYGDGKCKQVVVSIIYIFDKHAGRSFLMFVKDITNKAEAKHNITILLMR